MFAKLGSTCRFDYPQAFTTMPEYTAHRGHTVIVCRPLVDGLEYDGPCTDAPEFERMYKIRSLVDGWEGIAFASELSPL